MSAEAGGAPASTATAVPAPIPAPAGPAPLAGPIPAPAGPAPSTGPISAPSGPAPSAGPIPAPASPALSTGAHALGQPQVAGGGGGGGVHFGPLQQQFPDKAAGKSPAPPSSTRGEAVKAGCSLGCKICAGVTLGIFVLILIIFLVYFTLFAALAKVASEIKDPCVNEPCQNGGTCVGVWFALIQVYNCTCAPGFTGPTCNMTQSEQSLVPINSIFVSTSSILISTTTLSTTAAATTTTATTTTLAADAGGVPSDVSIADASAADITVDITAPTTSTSTASPGRKRRFVLGMALTDDDQNDDGDHGSAAVAKDVNTGRLVKTASRTRRLRLRKDVVNVRSKAKGESNSRFVERHGNN